jgi:hypothetical protein
MNNINKNAKIIIVVVAIIALGLSFYSGMRYGGGNVAAAAAARGANFGASGRGIGSIGGMRGGQNGGGIAGDIISKDATSITVGLRTGGSRIIFFGPSTSILTSASGTPSDLATGKQVSVQGTQNQDGSINANFIQVR